MKFEFSKFTFGKSTFLQTAIAHWWNQNQSETIKCSFILDFKVLRF